MKKYLFIFLLLASLSVWAKTLTISVVFFQSYPHNYINEKKETVGVAVNYMNTLAHKAGFKVDYVGPIPFTRIMEQLRDGTIDGAMFLSYKKERLKFLNYMSKPFDQGGQILLVKKDHPLVSLKNLDAIKDWRIGYFAGASKGILENRKDLNLHWDELSGDTWRDQNILKLKNGRIDAIYDQSRISLLLTAKRMGFKEEFKKLEFSSGNEKLYIAFSKKSPHSNLVEIFEKAINTIPSYHVFEEEFLDKN